MSSEGSKGISTNASAAAAPWSGLVGLRHGPVGRAIVALGLLALVGIYALPLARALTLPTGAIAKPLEQLAVPAFDFPRVNPPRAVARAAAALLLSWANDLYARV